MHALVLREDLHRQHPPLADALFQACTAAKTAAQTGMKYTAALRFMLPWLFDHLAELEQVFGPDPWPYGLEANRTTLNTFSRFLCDDGFVAQPPQLEDIFVAVHEIA